jgi:hypothetical protein
LKNNDKKGTDALLSHLGMMKMCRGPMFIGTARHLYRLRLENDVFVGAALAAIHLLRDGHNSAWIAAKAAPTNDCHRMIAI